MSDDGVIRFFSEKDAYGELSNFYPLKKPMELYGMKFATSEHAYQSRKYLQPDAPAANVAYARVIANANTPYESKILANRQRYGDYNWQVKLQEIMDAHPDAQLDPAFYDHIFEIMLEVLLAKFTTDEHCRKVLLSTGNSELIEMSPTDNFWGKCPDGSGENHLGRLLMVVREKLRANV